MSCWFVDFSLLFCPLRLLRLMSAQPGVVTARYDDPSFLASSGEGPSFADVFLRLVSAGGGLF